MVIKVTMPDEANVTSTSMETVLDCVSERIGDMHLSHPSKHKASIQIDGIGLVTYEYGWEL
jgi:hypothetical protein